MFKVKKIKLTILVLLVLVSFLNAIIVKFIKDNFEY